ncbi:FadR/GntR family transcriptional regulator [Microbacterium sp. 179-I 3D3 NHS]|uniref:FadR/GntR family transcriptional regulator n=1 Tax=unclassified Microbacterium TaxID=2609290 RepID=UPI0039A03E94
MSRLHRDVMGQLTGAIVSGALQPGALLPREVDLAEEYGVSRGTARETIRAMEERGLVQVRHGVGAIVNESAGWDLLAPEVLRALLTTAEGPQVLGQYIDTRRVIEVEAVSIAAELATDDDVATMRAELAVMEEVAALSAQGNPAAEQKFHEADLAFHQTIFAAARNQVLASLVRRIHEALYVARLALARPQFRVERALPEHEAIFHAIEAHDPERARQAMTAHLDTVATYLLESYAERHP